MKRGRELETGMWKEGEGRAWKRGSNLETEEKRYHSLTSMSILLNSSKHAHAPQDASPLKNLPIAL